MCRYASERSIDVTHSPCLSDVRIDSGVSILNFKTVRYWFRELWPITGLHLFPGLGTKNSRL